MDLHLVLEQTKLQNSMKISRTKVFFIKLKKPFSEPHPKGFIKRKEKKGSKPKLKFLSEIEKQTTLV
jgi:hypothetical protein